MRVRARARVGAGARAPARVLCLRAQPQSAIRITIIKHQSASRELGGGVCVGKIGLLRPRPQIDTSTETANKKE